MLCRVAGHLTTDDVACDVNNDFRHFLSIVFPELGCILNAKGSRNFIRACSGDQPIDIIEKNSRKLIENQAAFKLTLYVDLLDQPCRIQGNHSTAFLLSVMSDFLQSYHKFKTARLLKTIISLKIKSVQNRISGKCIQRLGPPSTDSELTYEHQMVVAANQLLSQCVSVRTGLFYCMGMDHFG